MSAEVEAEEGSSSIASRIRLLAGPSFAGSLKSSRVVPLFVLVFLVVTSLVCAFSPWLTFYWHSLDDSDPSFSFYFQYYELKHIEGNCSVHSERYEYNEMPCHISAVVFEDVLPGCYSFLQEMKGLFIPAGSLAVAVFVLSVPGIVLCLLWFQNPYDRKRLISLSALCLVSSACSLAAAVIPSSRTSDYLMRCFRDIIFDKTITFDFSKVDAISMKWGVAFHLAITIVFFQFIGLCVLLLEVRTLQTKGALIRYARHFDDQTTELRGTLAVSHTRMDALFYEYNMLDGMQEELQTRMRRLTSAHQREQLWGELERVRQSMQSTEEKVREQAVYHEHLQRERAELVADLTAKMDRYDENHQSLANSVIQKLTVLEEDMETLLRSGDSHKLQTLRNRVEDLDESADSSQLQMLRQEQVVLEKKIAERQRILDPDSSPHLRRFYLVFQSKLNAIFEASRVLSTGLVNRRSEKVGDKTAMFIELSSGLVPIPGFLLMASTISHALLTRGDYQAYSRAQKQANLFTSTVQMSDLVERTAFELVKQWESPLSELFVSSPNWKTDVDYHVGVSVQSCLEWIDEQTTSDQASIAIADNVFESPDETASCLAKALFQRVIWNKDFTTTDKKT